MLVFYFFDRILKKCMSMIDDPKHEMKVMNQVQNYKERLGYFSMSMGIRYSIYYSTEAMEPSI